MSNVPTVQHVYDAFGRGDVPTIVSHLSESIQWEYGMSDAGVPWLLATEGAGRSSEVLCCPRAFDLQQFQPKTFLGNVVVVLIDVAFIVKATGRSVIEEDEIHIWHFDSEGRVIRFCHKVDTHQHGSLSRRYKQEWIRLRPRGSVDVVDSERQRVQASGCAMFLRI